MTTDQVRAYLLTALGQAATGLGQIVLAFVVYFGMIPLMSRVYSFFAESEKKATCLYCNMGNGG